MCIRDSIDKIGTGTMTIDSAAGTGSYNLGSLTVSQGTLSLSGASGSATFGTINTYTGATLLLDNTAANLNNRLGGPNRTINLYGGELKITGNALAATSESIMFSNLTGTGVVTAQVGSSVLTLVPNAAQALSFNFGSIGNQVGGGVLLVRGTNSVSYTHLTLPTKRIV